MSTDTRRWRRVLTFVLVMMLTVASFMLTRNASERQEQIVVAQRTADAVTAIDRRMSAYTDLLYSGNGAHRFRSSVGPSRKGDRVSRPTGSKAD